MKMRTIKNEIKNVMFRKSKDLVFSQDLQHTVEQTLVVYV